MDENKKKEKQNRICKFEMRQAAGGSGEFSGYASVFGELNPYYDEIIDAGAFTQTLNHNGGKVPIFYMHGSWSVDDWIGFGMKATQDSHGLMVDGKLVVESSDSARAVYSLMQIAQEANRPVGISIGFSPVQMTQETNGTIHMTEVRLWEYSICPPDFQSAPNALVTDVRTSLRNYVTEYLAEIGIKAPVAARVTQGAENGGAADFHALNETLDIVLRKLKRK